jgi:hypothetical protein
LQQGNWSQVEADKKAIRIFVYCNGRVNFVFATRHDQAEKEQYVIQLYKVNKSTREIAKLTHMSFRDIGAAIRKAKLEADGERDQIEDDDIKSKSKITQAYKLFSELNTPVEVAIELDLPADQVMATYQEYWKLNGMYEIHVRNSWSEQLLLIKASTFLESISSREQEHTMANLLVVAVEINSIT